MGGESVRIAHISDLHFGVPGAVDIWRSLRTYLNNDIKPQLVLVTGDIVNTPDQGAFQTAKNELDQLSVPYKVCPGNHDRHPLGNAPGLFDTVLKLFRSTTSAHAWFDQVFGAYVARHEDGPIFTLSNGTHSWRVGIVGFDTSAAAKHSAQGFAELRSIQQLTTTLDNTSDCDLVIVLLHHHLLPIAELERSKQSLRQLLAPTIMLNAGTMLEMLAQGNANLVLHGHEHHRAVARYGTLTGGRSDVVILAAGSATGVRTLEDADQAYASLNLIELRSDRTVWVREIKNRVSVWEIDDRPAIELLDSRQIDRAGFYRRNRSASPPTSRILKCVEFDANRNITLTETRTHWAIEQGRWQTITQNSSGWPSPAQIEVEWPQMGRAELPPIKALLDPSDDHTYRYEVNLGGQDLALARQIKVAFQWMGGGILTEGDFDLLDPARRGAFRNEGLEFAGARVENDLEMLSLVVRIPPDFAPPHESIQVSTLPHGAPASQRRTDALLTRALDHHAPGMFSLQVHYPTKGRNYVISWTPPPRRKPSNPARAFYEKARDAERASVLLRAFHQAIIRIRDRLRDATVALYVPIVDEEVVLKRVAYLMPDRLQDREPPDAQLSLRDGDTLYRYGWWGKAMFALRDDNDDREYGFALDEQALAVFPLSPYARAGDVPWGLVRIGFHTDAGFSRDELLNVMSSDMLHEGALSLLQSAAEMQ